METRGVNSKKAAYDEFDDPYTLPSVKPKHYSSERELPDISHHPSGFKKADHGQNITKPGEAAVKPPTALPQTSTLHKPIGSYQATPAKPQDPKTRVPARPVSVMEEAPKISEDFEYEHRISDVGRAHCKCFIM
jgi:hypothetical protein